MNGDAKSFRIGRVGAEAHGISPTTRTADTIDRGSGRKVTLLEAKVLIERWRVEYNTVRPHSSLGYRPPAPETRQPHKSTSATLQRPCAADLLTMTCSLNPGPCGM